MKRTLVAGAMAAIVALGLAGTAGATTTSLKKLTLAGYEASGPGIDELQATITVPTVTCHATYTSLVIVVAVAGQVDGSGGAVEVDCLPKGRSEDFLYVFAGESPNTPGEVVHPGDRARITVLQASGRLYAEASIAGRRQVHISAKGSPQRSLELAALAPAAKDQKVSPILIRFASVNGRPLGDFSHLKRTTERESGKVIATAGPIRRGRSFVIRQR